MGPWGPTTSACSTNQEAGKIEIVWIADVMEDRARELAERYGVDWFTDYKRLLEKKPDFVVVSVPTKLHRKVAVDAIEEGCHVLVEKPIAHTISDGREIVEVAKRRELGGRWFI